MFLLCRWSEVAYFRRWYANKPLETRAAIKELVQAGRLEFVLGGWSSIAPEMSHFEDLLTTFEQSQRWLLEEFGYRCVVAYVAPQTFMSKQMASLLRSGGVEMLVIDGASPAWFEALRKSNAGEFLWETDPYFGEESRLFTHLCKERSGLWGVVKRILNKYGSWMESTEAMWRQPCPNCGQFSPQKSIK